MTEKPFCLIIAGSPDCDLPASCRRADYIIACDRGGLHARRFGFQPDLWVGDFDSSDPGDGGGAELLRAPAEKDDTDTMLALREARKRGYDRVVIAGALGGRLDHTVANLQLLSAARAMDMQARIVDRNHLIFILNRESIRLRRRDWRYVSLFAAEGRCEGVTLRGLKYPLQEGTLTGDFPVGVSNEFTNDQAVISVRKGPLLVILTRSE